MFLLTLASFVFFAFVPLPRAYYPEFVFHRPEEFGPAILFAVALYGHLRMGEWRHDPFEHWLVLALIVGLTGQAAFMSFSGGLFDLEFDVAHLLKKVSYICVLTGLLISMYVTFDQSLRDSEQRLQTLIDTMTDGVITIDHQGIIRSVNPAAERHFGYTTEELLGRTSIC